LYREKHFWNLIYDNYICILNVSFLIPYFLVINSVIWPFIDYNFIYFFQCTHRSFQREKSRSLCCQSSPRLMGPVMEATGMRPASKDCCKMGRGWKAGNCCWLCILQI